MDQESFTYIWGQAFMDTEPDYNSTYPPPPFAWSNDNLGDDENDVFQNVFLTYICETALL